MDTKKIVIPGELLSDDSSLSGSGTYVSGGKVYASVCGLLIQKGKLSVHPLSGPYLPKKNDLVIGYVTVVTSSNWIFDIGCPYEGLLHVTEYPIRVPSEEMQNHFTIGDTVLLKVTDVNAEMKIELTYKDSACRKLTRGRLVDVSSSKISRIIGRSGAMISMLKAKTRCDIFVGGNGRIWMDGSSESMDILMGALKKIEAEAHVSGLTDLTAAYIDKQYKLLNPETDFIADIPAEGTDSENLSAQVKPALKKKNDSLKSGGKKERKGKQSTKSADTVAADTVADTATAAAADNAALASVESKATKTTPVSAQKSKVPKNKAQPVSVSENCTCFNSVFFTHPPAGGDKSDR